MLVYLDVHFYMVEACKWDELFCELESHFFCVSKLSTIVEYLVGSCIDVINVSVKFMFHMCFIQMTYIYDVLVLY